MDFTTKAQPTLPAAQLVMVVGVVADTHIPDRVSALHPCLIPRLAEAGVGHILHAGDISTRGVLEALGRVATVTAVRGNRDVLAGPLRMVEEIELGGVRLALMHGHGGLLHYLHDKLDFIRSGYQLERYLPRLRQVSRPVRVVVFGHTHFPVNQMDGSLLLLNPGSASFGTHLGAMPSFGLLRIFADGRIEAEILKLGGYEVKNRRWVKKQR